MAQSVLDRPAGAGAPGARVVPARTGAEAILQTMVAHGVDYVFLNPGTDTAPLQEAFVALAARGERVPTVVPCLYENVALAAAHGYFLVTRRPQVVMVHVDVGTQNLGGNLHNTQRGQAGVVILAGRSPYTVDGDVPGARDRAIQWQQDQLDQTGIVRNYVKWAHELGRTDTLHQLVARAFQLAGSEPCGAVYMTAAREVLMAPMDGVTLLPPERYRPLVTPAGDPAAIEQIAEWLVEAEQPLAIAGAVGRRPAAVPELVALAELLGLRVADTRGPMNFPADHPLFVTGGVAPALGRADVVLLLDVDVPWIPKEGGPRPDARIAQIDIDPIKATIPVWGFPVDLPVQGDTSKALRLLREAVERRATPERRARWAERAEQAAPARKQAAARRANVAERVGSKHPIEVEWLAACLAEKVTDEALVLEEAVTSAETLRRYLRRNRPGSLLHSGAPGLGWALGAAVGAKLAEPHRDVVALVGDGSFVFGSPVAALWAAQQARAPFLAVVCNNSGYNASKQPVLQLFPEGMSVTSNQFPGARFNTPPDYAALARSCHAYGERVENPGELPAALERALAATRAGQAAVLDVILNPI